MAPIQILIYIILNVLRFGVCILYSVIRTSYLIKYILYIIVKSINTLYNSTYNYIKWTIILWHRILIKKILSQITLISVMASIEYKMSHASPYKTFSYLYFKNHTLLLKIENSNFLLTLKFCCSYVTLDKNILNYFGTNYCIKDSRCLLQLTFPHECNGLWDIQ